MDAEALSPTARHSVDPAFLALPLDALADAALSTARAHGAEHADVRVERVRTRQTAIRDTQLAGMHDGEDLGLAVRVVLDGTWGFAATADLTSDAATATAEQALAVARVSRPLRTRAVTLADEPVWQGTWVSDYAIDPFDVEVAEVVALLGDYAGRVLADPRVQHATASLHQVRESTFYADLAGTRTIQQRVRLHPEVEALGVDSATGGFETMRTIAAPVARGWEYVTGADGVHDWARELADLPELLAERLAAPSVQAGTYDLVIDPSNLWLTIHESIGHATELDRALGYEANYAGTSFATPDQLGTLRYGSEIMNVTGDRTTPHGLATVAWDSEGVAAQSWDIIKDGRLVGYQLDRSSATLLDGGTARSNGCAFADSPCHVAIQRMANVSLQPSAEPSSVDDLIGQVDDGLYVVGDKSWSIDMQRYNFQFTAQRFYRISGGRLAGQVTDAAYQGRTPDFWGSLAALGDSSTWMLGGAFNCGKAQPGQVAPVSHGAPATLFRGVNVLNTDAEGQR
jgi:TldD protein